ncbi:hypothetical protein HK102_013295 [Quaeritorhiza haematococci]|nr:hypothetical protein HK102_013295 [Quaeritorhiza haematococci]
MTIVRQRIETPVPRKRKGSTTNYEKGLQRFFDQVYQAILRHVNFEVVKALIIASPGFVKDQLFKYVMDEAIKTDNKVLMENKSKMVLVHSSSGQKHALQEILQEPAIQTRLADTKYAQEVKSMDRFYQTLASDAARAFYGFKHVCKAAEQGAIETLMVTDELFRSSNLQTRRQYIDLVEKARSQGGTVLIFSSLHTSGEQLGQLTGVAAILTFPLPGLEDEVAEEEEAERAAALAGDADVDSEEDDAHG